MKILYYELSQGRKTPVYFWFRHINKLYNSDNWGPLRLAHLSTRIWEWDSETDSVRCIKNRETGIKTKADRDEFLMVQLQSVEWRNETT